MKSNKKIFEIIKYVSKIQIKKKRCSYDKINHNSNSDNDYGDNSNSNDGLAQNTF